MKKYTKHITRAAIIPCAVLLLASSAQAQFVATYDFNGEDPSADLTGLDAAGVTAGNFLAIGGADFNDVNAADFQASLRTERTGNDLAAALDDLDGETSGVPGVYDNTYFSFTLSAANPGEFLDLDSFTLSYGGASAGTIDWTTNLVVQSSVGGFGAGNPTLTVTPSSFLVDVDPATNPMTSATVTLSGTAFDSLSSIEFRLAFFDDTGSSGRQNRIDDVVISGSVTSIPEPSSVWLLIGAGGLGLLLRRRFKRGAQ